MNGRDIYRRVHFYLGNVYRFLTIQQYQVSIEVDEARTIFGSSFGSDGWHHLICTLEEYDQDHNIDYRTTSLYSYLKYFQPISICDLLETPYVEKCNLPLFVFPWGTFKKGQVVSNKEPGKSRFCGPSSDLFIKDEFDRTIYLYEEIKKTGYKPWSFGNTFIGGTFLVSKEGERRFIVLQGNHRMAILAHLGYKHIKVRDVKGYMVKVNESAILDWPLVKTGGCSKGIAESIFRLYFAQNGYHIHKIVKQA